MDLEQLKTKIEHELKELKALNTGLQEGDTKIRMEATITALEGVLKWIEWD